MTSLEIAELTGKQHKDVMKAIRNMEPAWEKNSRLEILSWGPYKDANGTTSPLLPTDQDRVPVHRHEVQRRGACEAGAEMGGAGASI